jgi:hypothetical protein
VSKVTETPSTPVTYRGARPSMLPSSSMRCNGRHTRPAWSLTREALEDPGLIDDDRTQDLHGVVVGQGAPA